MSTKRKRVDSSSDPRQKDAKKSKNDSPDEKTHTKKVNNVSEQKSGSHKKSSPKTISSPAKKALFPGKSAPKLNKKDDKVDGEVITIDDDPRVPLAAIKNSLDMSASGKDSTPKKGKDEKQNKSTPTSSKQKVVNSKEKTKSPSKDKAPRTPASKSPLDKGPVEVTLYRLAVTKETAKKVLAIDTQYL